MESQEEQLGVAGEAAGVTGGAARSHKRSGMESQEESCGDLRGAPWSSKFCTSLLPAILINNILKFQLLPIYQGVI